MMSIEHIGIPARDTTRLAEWYREKLDFNIIFRSESTPPVYFVAASNGVCLEIVPPGTDNAVDNAANTHLAILSDDFDETIDLLRARGIEFEPETANGFFGGTRMRFFTDPEGHRHQIVARQHPLISE